MAAWEESWSSMAWNNMAVVLVCSCSMVWVRLLAHSLAGRLQMRQRRGGSPSSVRSIFCPLGVSMSMSKSLPRGELSSMELMVFACFGADFVAGAADGVCPVKPQDCFGQLSAVHSGDFHIVVGSGQAVPVFFLQVCFQSFFGGFFFSDKPGIVFFLLLIYGYYRLERGKMQRCTDEYGVRRGWDLKLFIFFL